MGKQQHLGDVFWKGRDSAAMGYGEWNGMENVKPYVGVSERVLAARLRLVGAGELGARLIGVLCT